MGGVIHSAARSVNVAQEMEWLGLRGSKHLAEVRRQYLVMERQALRILNKRSAEAVGKATKQTDPRPR